MWLCIDQDTPDSVEYLHFVFRSLMTDIDTLLEVDGYAAWREKEANDLSDLVQRRFDFLQNPQDCGSARKLVCNLNKVM